MEDDQADLLLRIFLEEFSYGADSERYSCDLKRGNQSMDKGGFLIG